MPTSHFDSTLIFYPTLTAVKSTISHLFSKLLTAPGADIQLYVAGKQTILQLTVQAIKTGKGNVKKSRFYSTLLLLRKYLLVNRNQLLQCKMLLEEKVETLLVFVKPPFYIHRSRILLRKLFFGCSLFRTLL